MPNVRRYIRTALSTHPWIYLPLASFLSVGTPTQRDTEIVIEGFPRSANSFAEAAFRVSQSREVKIAHHCHAAAQVIAAARWSIPCLVIIREPEEACRSLLMHHPDLFEVEDLFREYIIFHKNILPFRRDFVLAKFETVTERFPDIIKSVNSRFETNFLVPEEVETQRIFDEVDRLSRQRGMTDDGGEAYSPSRSIQDQRQREAEKLYARTLIRKMHGKEKFLEAEKLYKELLHSADL